MPENTPFGHQEEVDLTNIVFVDDVDIYLFSEKPYIEIKEDQEWEK